MSPIFEFACIKCGYKFEELASVGGETLPWVKCPKCKSPQIRRVPSVSNIKVIGGTEKFYPKGKGDKT